MRDIVFKNLVSDQKKRRIISTSEVTDDKGIRSVIRRHFVYIVKQISGRQVNRPVPYLYVLKEHNNKEQKEKFFCRIKGSMYTVCNGKPLLILFMHSLKITFKTLPLESKEVCS
ncbi:MAG: hypothetical protein V2A64_05620 [Candidatus Omnitrophota bacterium]